MTASGFPNDVACLLAEGFGAEDIAIKLSATTDSVRRVIWDMRFAGTLDILYRYKAKGRDNA